MLLHFWKRWHKEYVTSLQERKRGARKLPIGKLVKLSSSLTTRWRLYSGRWDTSCTYIMVLTILCELSKFQRNMQSTTELYTNSRNCLYLLTKNVSHILIYCVVHVLILSRMNQGVRYMLPTDFLETKFLNFNFHSNFRKLCSNIK